MEDSPGPARKPIPGPLAPGEPLWITRMDGAGGNCGCPFGLNLHGGPAGHACGAPLLEQFHAPHAFSRIGPEDRHGLRSPGRIHAEVRGGLCRPGGQGDCFLKFCCPSNPGYTPGRPHHQDRNAGRTENPIRYAPPNPAAYSRSAMGGDDDQIDLILLGKICQLLRNSPE